MKRRRRGLSLPELMIATAVMSMIILAVGLLSSAVQESRDYSSGKNTAVQNARVALDRIQRNLNEATANEDFHGFQVFGETIDGYYYPDTLVIWNPAGAPANPDGSPLYSEIVIYCPNPTTPNELWEITIPTIAAAVPAFSDTASWLSILSVIKKSWIPKKVVITDMMRVSQVKRDSFGVASRGGLRFDVRVLPSVDDWADIQGGALIWEDAPWVQEVYSSRTGLRQAWCQIELHLMPTDSNTQIDNTGDTALPFFGSGALYYQMDKP